MSRFLFSDTGNIIFGILKIGKNNPEISYFEFENHKNLNFSIFRRVVRARKKIYLYKYYLGFFKICPSFNNPAEIVLNKVHIAQWQQRQQHVQCTCANIFLKGRVLHTSNTFVKLCLMVLSTERRKQQE